MTRRRHYGDAVRREEIVTAAIGLIAEHGMPQATLARIAAAAGLTNAAVLYYFRGKAEVIDAAYASVIASVSAAVGDAMNAASTGRAEVEAYIRALTGHLTRQPDQVRFLMRFLIADAERAPRSETAQPRWAPLAAAITRGCDEGDLSCTDPRTTAIAIGGSVDAIFAESIIDPDYAVDEAIERLLALIFRSLDAERR